MTEPRVDSERGDPRARWSDLLTAGAVLALGAALVVLVVWMLTVILGVQKVANTTAVTTRHTDAEVLRIVTDDQAHIASLTSEIAALTAAGHDDSAQVRSLEAELATVHAELNAVLAATTASQRQVIVQQYSAPTTSTTDARTATTTTTRPPTTTTQPPLIPIGLARPRPRAGTAPR